MKLNVDLSNSELTHFLSSFKDGAKREAELTHLLDAANQRVYSLSDENYSFKLKVSGLEDGRKSLEAENTRLRTLLSNPPSIDGIPSPMNLEQAQALLNAGALAEHGEKLEAIKMARNAAHCGLKEAKDLVEAITSPREHMNRRRDFLGAR